MGRELRNHPRVPTNWPCSLQSTENDDAVKAHAFSVANQGLGVQVDADSNVSLAVGETVTIALELETDEALVVGTVAWVQRTPNRSCCIGVKLSPQSPREVHPYKAWVAERFASLREESLQLGGTLAADRLITLRALQQALDDQARDGGFLCDHLDAV